MIIDNIPYTRVEEENVCSISACLFMLLRYYGIMKAPSEISDEFSSTFMSRKFNEWYTHSLDMNKYEENAMLCCAQFMLEAKYPELKAGIVPSTVEKTRLSYLKRRIPVIMTGRFPLLSGRIPNTILIKGYIDKYMVVNDPRGNANTGYTDRYGENMLYHINDLTGWTTPGNDVYLLRAITPKR